METKYKQISTAIPRISRNVLVDFVSKHCMREVELDETYIIENESMRIKVGFSPSHTTGLFCTITLDTSVPYTSILGKEKTEYSINSILACLDEYRNEYASKDINDIDDLVKEINRLCMTLEGVYDSVVKKKSVLLDKLSKENDTIRDHILALLVDAAPTAPEDEILKADWEYGRENYYNAYRIYEAHKESLDPRRMMRYEYLKRMYDCADS